MTYGEKAKNASSAGMGFFGVLFCSIVSTFVVAGMYANQTSFLTEDGWLHFMCLMVLCCVFMGVFMFSYSNVYFFIVLKTKLGFQKEHYTNIHDVSVEWMIAKSSFVFFAVLGLFSHSQWITVESVGGLFFVVLIALSSGYACMISVLLLAMVYFNRYAVETKTTIKEIKKDVSINHNVFSYIQSSLYFKEECVSLHALWTEYNKKENVDIEKEHALHSDLVRLEKSLNLFEQLSGKNQEKIKCEMQMMFSIIEENIKNILEETEQELMLQIKKQGMLLNK